MPYRRHTDSPWFLVALILALYVIISTCDYQDELKEQEHYCGMVNAGVWPDYRRLGKTCDQYD